MKGKNKFISISKKITIMMSIMVIICTIFISFFSYYSYRGDTIKQQGNAALAVSSAVAAGIDTEKFKETASAAVQNDYFKQIRELFNDVKANTKILYLYPCCCKWPTVISAQELKAITRAISA